MIKRLLLCLIIVITTIPALVFAADGQPYSISPEVVQGKSESQELVGPYHQPRWSTRGRFSTDTDVYVLPPFFFYIDMDYQAIIRKHDDSR